MNLIEPLLRMMLLAFLGTPEISVEKGLATRFGDPGDPLDGDRLSCVRRPMLPGEHACAHRTLPCGTTLIVENPRTGAITTCAVLDRGPYGAILKNGKWVIKLRKKDPGSWRGVLDLSPSVARALKHNGREPVRLYYARSNPKGRRGN